MARFSAYPIFPTLDAARKGLSRKRSMTTFILEGSTSELKRVKCASCGKALSDFSGVDSDGKELHPDGYRGNRCDRYANGQIYSRHYVCAWTRTIQQIVTTRRRERAVSARLDPSTNGRAVRFR